jgi:NitT/TauT family transport system substrate-binding protein
MTNRIAFLFFSVAVLSLFACSLSEPEEKPREQVRLQLKWLHQAQFAGYYLALEKGFYADENLHVTFIEGGHDIDQCEQLVYGKADIAVTAAETVFLRQTPGHPLVALAAIYQRSAVVFVAKRQSAIRRPDDFTGKTIAVGNMDSGGFVEAHVQFQALMQKVGVGTAGITVAPYDMLYADFLADIVDVTPSYITGGVIKLRNQGVDLRLIWPGDYGISFYCDTLVTSSEYLKNNRDTALRFLRATLKGWQYAIEHSEEAVDATMQYTKSKDRKMQLDMHEAQIPLVHTGLYPIGWMQKEVWQDMHDLLLQQGFLHQPVVDINAIFTSDLLKTIYPSVEK